MAQQTYVGIRPEIARAKLDEISALLTAWRQKCRPYGPQFVAIMAIQTAIREGQEALTGKASAAGLGASTPGGL
jgi:hypothetical protein